MKHLSRIGSVLTLAATTLVFCTGLPCSAQSAATPASPANHAADDQLLKDFAAIHPIDTHVHVFKTDPAFQKMLEEFSLKALDILVMDDTSPHRSQLQPEVGNALKLVESSHGHMALCTTFDPYTFNSPTFTADSIKQLDRDFSHGALAVKIWKNIGMEIKDGNGKYIVADDPKLDPIYADIESHGRTLLSHQAEPDVAWGPPDPADPSWSYYQENPQWYLGDKKGFPAKATILDARDHILASHPKLRMVGVHLGSMERNLNDIARRLDKSPNFAVDMAARMEYLMLKPTDETRAFLIKYQDRVLYGTDLELLPDANITETLPEWRGRYLRDWRYLATDQTFTDEGRTVHALKLPREVLEKIFHGNAVHWIPGL